MVYVNWVVKIYEKVRIGDVYYPLYHIANLFTIPLALTNLLSIYAASNMWDWTQCLYVMYLTYETKQTRRKSRRRVVQFRSQFVHPENVMKLMIRTDHLTFRDPPPISESDFFHRTKKKSDYLFWHEISVFFLCNQISRWKLPREFNFLGPCFWSIFIFALKFGDKLFQKKHTPLKVKWTLS